MIVLKKTMSYHWINKQRSRIVILTMSMENWNAVYISIHPCFENYVEKKGDTKILSAEKKGKVQCSNFSLLIKKLEN